MKREKKFDQKEWNKNNPDKVREHRRRWKLKNAEKVATSDRRWRLEHPEKVAEYQRRWREKNLEKATENNRRWYRRQRAKKPPVKDLDKKIAALVPANISGLVREDICQQIAVEILSGEILLKDVPEHIERIRKAQSKFLPSRYLHRLDALEPWQRERIEQRVAIR